VTPYHKTRHGQIILADSLDYMAALKPGSVDLIVTSPPFGLLRKKDYGNVESGDYIEWFKPFGAQFKRLLKSSGSLVIDIGGAWLPGAADPLLVSFRAGNNALPRDGVLSSAGIFLVEPVKASEPRGVGDGTPHKSQGRRQHRVVVFGDALAQSKQPQGISAVQPSDEGTAQEWI